MRTTPFLAAALIAGSGLVVHPAQAKKPETGRTELTHRDLGDSVREVIQTRVDFAPGAAFPRHSHPGVEVAYVLEGALEYRLEGKPPVTLKAGASLFIPAGMIHSARNVGRGDAAELATYIVEKGKPLVEKATSRGTMTEPLTKPTDLLFSYGTLQLEPVQWATFGRRLEGTEDCLVGYKSRWLQIADSTVVEASGKLRHPIITFTGRPTDLACGTVFRVTSDELRQADAYEVAAYKRVCLTLASGKSAWVYVDARDEAPGPFHRAEHLQEPGEKS